jgi:AcrR family transcriptional regulator
LFRSAQAGEAVVTGELRQAPARTGRAQAALERAFIDLLRERRYDAITVGDVVARAGVGRTTFYRYYETKADMLVSIHAARFRALRFAPATREAWLCAAPPDDLVRLLERAQGHERLPTFLAYLGKDVDAVHRALDNLLAAHFEASLCKAFPQAQPSIPFPVLARMMAGAFSWALKAWVMERPPHTPPEMAAYIHQLLRGMLAAAGV